MRYLMTFVAAAGLAACQPADTDNDLPLDGATDALAPVTKPGDVEIIDDQVRLVMGMPVAEARACILPITVANGTDADVTITMIGFTVSGPGEDSQANMFAPAAAPGETSKPRIILEGQSCDAYDTVKVENIQCKADGESCNAALDYIDHAEMSFAVVE